MCKYCEALTPKKVLGVGNLPVGKPFFYNRDDIGLYAYAVIAHDEVRDEWTLNFMWCGVGRYINIRYCPHCGRRLEEEA